MNWHKPIIINGKAFFSDLATCRFMVIMFCLGFVGGGCFCYPLD